jgi:pimeloyl-ACP methyl ester carboxylesterase
VTLKRRSTRRYGFDTLLRELARASDAELQRTSPPPRKLGRYVLGPLVGRGGMGAVYRARDQELGREVAVKLVQAKRGSIGLVRFSREVRALALLSHPNVVAIHDAALHRGTAYLVMELISGETLRQLLLRELKPSLQQAAHFARQIAEALMAAHERGIVHRDLKPENIIVMEQGHVKVLDFGLAQLNALGTDQTEHRATLTGAVLGTPHYMSPEQVRGRRATPRSDVFAFGAVLYEMLCGRRAFGATSAAEAYGRILHTEPEALKGAQQTSLRGRLLSVARRCLAKDPHARYASGAELVAALADAASKRAAADRGSMSTERGGGSRGLGRRRTTRYASAQDGVHVAYQVIGDGPIDLCFVTGFVSNLDVWWEQAPGRAFFAGLATHTRLIMFDKRGTGLSDRVPTETQTLDGRVDDLRAVLDAAGSRQTVLFGDAGATVIRFAALYPERTRALVLYGTTERSWRTPEAVRELLVSRWGTGVSVPIVAPSVASDPAMVRWIARWERLGVSPGSLMSLLEAMEDIDVSADARAIRAPTLVLHRVGDRTNPVQAGRALAKLIPNARYSEHEGDDHAPMVGDSERIVREVLEFIADLPPTDAALPAARKRKRSR